MGLYYTKEETKQKYIDDFVDIKLQTIQNDETLNIQLTDFLVAFNNTYDIERKSRIRDDMLIKINIYNEDLKVLENVNETRSKIAGTYNKLYDLNNEYPRKLKLHNIDMTHDINSWIQGERNKNKEIKSNTCYGSHDTTYLNLLDLIKVMKTQIIKYNNELPQICINDPSRYIINSFVDMFNKIFITQCTFRNILMLPEIFDYIIQIYKNIIFDQIISMDLNSFQYIIKYIRN